MPCSIFKFNENKINIDLSNNKTNLCLHIPDHLMFDLYYNIIEIGFVYRNSEYDCCCLLSNISVIPNGWQDFKLLVRNNRIVLLHHSLSYAFPSNITKLANVYFDYNFIDGNYYKLRIFFDTINDIIRCEVNNVDITSTSNYYNVFSNENHIYFRPNERIINYSVNYTDIWIKYKTFIGDSPILYSDINNLYTNKNYDFLAISRNVGNCSICYIRLYIHNDNAPLNLIECKFNGDPNYNIDDAFNTSNLYFELYNSYTNDLDSDWNDDGNDLLCCNDCHYKYIINIDRIIATTKALINSFSLDSVEIINITTDENANLECYNPGVEYILNTIYNYLYNSGYNYFVYFFTDNNNCVSLRIKLDTCNLKINVEGSNFYFYNITYSNIDDCCKIPIEYGCCLDTYKIDKNLLYLKKIFTNIIFDDIEDFYKYKKSYNNLLYNKYKKLLLYNSIIFLREIESKYCLDNYNIKKYLKDINCKIKNNDYICLYENIEDMKVCCDDNEFELLCSCKDEYPQKFKEYNYYIDVSSNTYPSNGYNILSIVNEDIDKYKCCEQGTGLEFKGIVNNELTHLSINQIFNQNTLKFTSFLLVGPPTVYDTPKVQSFEILFKYCNKHEVRKKINVHFIKSCKEPTKAPDDYHKIQYNNNVDINSNDIITVNTNFLSGYEFVPCCYDTPSFSLNPNIQGFEVITYDNVINILSINNILSNLFISYTINPNNIKYSDLIEVEKCKFIYKKNIKVKIKECNKWYEHELEFNILVSIDETNNVKIVNGDILSPIIIPFTGSDTQYSYSIGICSKRCCDNICGSTISLPELITGGSSATITLYYKNIFNLIVSASVTVSAYWIENNYDFNDCECLMNYYITLLFNRNNVNELTQFPNLPNGLNPVYVLVQIKKCNGEIKNEYIKIFDIQK